MTPPPHHPPLVKESPKSGVISNTKEIKTLGKYSQEFFLFPAFWTASIFSFPLDSKSVLNVAGTALRNRHHIVAAFRAGVRLDSIIDIPPGLTPDDDPAHAQDPHVIQYGRLSNMNRIHDFPAAFFAFPKII